MIMFFFLAKAYDVSTILQYYLPCGSNCGHTTGYGYEIKLSLKNDSYMWCLADPCIIQCPPKVLGQFVKIYK